MKVIPKFITQDLSDARNKSWCKRDNKCLFWNRCCLL